ncbi:MAG: oligosaccharide flippase family protein [Rhodobacter sp.]|nr:oligosaccharide flippase family protein [Rhodobacter sp.]
MQTASSLRGSVDSPVTGIAGTLRRTGLISRVARGSAWIALGYLTSQALRLGANLILTRLLFPEAFGLMALVTVFIVGLSMFSDIGIGPSISQSKRGDDPDFLNTAWTIQVIRGFGLWLVSCALAWPAAQFYAEPLLAILLPLAGLAMVVSGFDTTRIETAHRHLLLGRVTGLDLISQIIGIVAMIALAIAFQSVFALVAGNLVGVAARLILMHHHLPGAPNRFRWERAAARELLHFGKWIFASTAFGFCSSQGDKAILGKFLTLSMLGIYNIGFFLASFPIQLGYALTGRILIPIYRESPVGASRDDRTRVRKMRFVLTGTLLGLVLFMAFLGPFLVALLYDARYAPAGAIVAAIACIQIPQIIGMSYDQAALAAGDSKGFCLLSCARAVIQLSLLLAGTMTYGLVGAMVGMGIAALAVHPLIIWLAVRHRVWDMQHDLVFAVMGGSLGGLALWLNLDAILALR